MTLPFTVEQFLQVFERYNAAIWPLQLVAGVAGLAVVALALARSPSAGRAAAAVLAAMWLVNGIGYHLSFFREINPAAIGFGALFIVQAALLIWQGVFRDRLQPALGRDARTGVALVAIAYAMLGYPLLGYLLGHVYPAAPIFGVAPCPTAIFTLGVLLLARPALPGWLFAIPLAWSVVGGSAAFVLEVREDLGLVAAGALSAAVLILSFLKRNRNEAHA
jgi:hypothetical protein